MEKTWYLYILRCGDDTLYTGITTDVQRRFEEHRSKPVGAKYTASHMPQSVERAWEMPDRSAASRLEYRIKKLPRPKKEELIRGTISIDTLLET